MMPVADISKWSGRLRVAACCVAIFWPGTLVFGFPGVMARYWQTAFSVGRADTGRILFFVLAAVGIFMFVVGKLQNKVGPGRLAAAGAVVGAASSLMVAGAATIVHVYLWAFMIGTASALVYLPGLTVVQQWYPKRRGLVSGLFNLCFGGSAALVSPLYSRLLADAGYAATALVAAVCVLVFGLIAAVFIRFPPPAADTAAARSPITSLTVAQSLKTQSFWLLWGTWALAGAAGISMVMLSVSFGLAKGLGLAQAVLLLTAFNLTNGISRLISGFVSDVLGRKKTLAATFAAAAAAYFLIDHLAAFWLWMAMTAVVGFALGTLFAVSAPLASECFGLDHFGAIYGLVFTAYGFFSGILGPWLAGMMLDRSGGQFGPVFIYLGVLYLVSAVLILKTTPQSECVYTG